MNSTLPAPLRALPYKHSLHRCLPLRSASKLHIRSIATPPISTSTYLSPTSSDSSESLGSRSSMSIKARRWFSLCKYELDTNKSYYGQLIKTHARDWSKPGRQIIKACREKATQIIPSATDLFSGPPHLEVTSRVDYPPSPQYQSHPKLNLQHPYRFSPRFSLTSTASGNQELTILSHPKIEREVAPAFSRRGAISAPVSSLSSFYPRSELLSYKPPLVYPQRQALPTGPAPCTDLSDILLPSNITFSLHSKLSDVDAIPPPLRIRKNTVPRPVLPRNPYS